MNEKDYFALREKIKKEIMDGPWKEVKVTVEGCVDKPLVYSIEVPECAAHAVGAYMVDIANDYLTEGDCWEKTVSSEIRDEINARIKCKGIMSIADQKHVDCYGRPKGRYIMFDSDPGEVFEKILKTLQDEGIDCFEVSDFKD